MHSDGLHSNFISPEVDAGVTYLFDLSFWHGVASCLLI